MNWYLIYGCIFASALILSLIFTPLCRKIAFLSGFLDVPAIQAHKGHKKATPLLGGLAMSWAWIITISAGYIGMIYMKSGTHSFPLTPDGANPEAASRHLLGICAAALMAVFLGLYDDRFALSAKVKLIGQIIVAFVAVSLGDVKITIFFTNPVIVYGISIFWLLLIMNSINFFDNMDGLAAGTASIALSIFGIAAAANQQYLVAALGASTAGAAIGFWVYNHSPASIFMGDSGSHFLGLMLGIVSAKITYYSPETSSSYLPFLIPLFVLAVPLFDTAAVVVIRLWNHKPIYIGDHNHLSHRFHHMGMSRKHAVLMVHLLTLITGLGALPLLWGDERTCAVLFVQIAVVLLMITILQWIIRPEKQ